MSELSHSCGSEGCEACDDDRGGLDRCCAPKRFVLYESIVLVREKETESW